MDRVQRMRPQLEEKKIVNVTEQRLDTDDVDGTQLQPDPRGMERDGTLCSSRWKRKIRPYYTFSFGETANCRKDSGPNVPALDFEHHSGLGLEANVMLSWPLEALKQTPSWSLHAEDTHSTLYPGWCLWSTTSPAPLKKHRLWALPSLDLKSMQADRQYRKDTHTHTHTNTHTVKQYTRL